MEKIGEATPNKAHDGLPLEKAIGTLPKKAQAAAKALVDLTLAQFKSKEEARIAGETTKATKELMKSWKQEIEDTRMGTDEYTKKIRELEKAYQKYGLAIPPATKNEIEYQRHLKETLEITRQRIVNMDAFIQRWQRLVTVEGMLAHTYGIIPEGERQDRTTRVGGKTVEQLDAFREKMRSLAGDLTNTLADSLHQGFERGIGEGFRAFEMGILKMVESSALDALQKRLSDVFTKALGGTSSGGGIMGWILKIIGIGAGAVGGGGAGKAFNAAIPGAFNFAKGGMVPGIDRGYDSVPAMLEPGERVMTRAQQMNMGGNHFHVHINVPNVAAAGSSATQHQIAKQLHGMMAKAVLTG